MDFSENAPENEVSVAIERRPNDSSPRYIAGHTAMLIEQIRRHYAPGKIHGGRHPVVSWITWRVLEKFLTKVYEDSKELGE